MEYTTKPCITEADIDRCFLETFNAYVRNVPPKQAEELVSSMAIFLVPWCQLSSPNKLKLMNLLWEHRNSPLEAGYRLKEELKRWLYCRNSAERRAMARILCQCHASVESQVPAFLPLIRSLETQLAEPKPVSVAAEQFQPASIVF